MSTELEERIQVHSERFNKELENIIRNDEVKRRNKKYTKGMNSTLSDSEVCINDLEDRTMETALSEQQKENLKTKTRDFGDNIKHIKICIIRVPEGKESKKNIENIVEIIAKKFQNLKKEIDTQV